MISLMFSGAASPDGCRTTDEDAIPMALDEATTAFLTEAAKAGGPALHEMSVAEAREMNAGLSALYGEGPPVASVKDVRIESTDGATFPARVFRPEAPRGVMLYLHGGGWVVGDLDGFDTLCRQIVDRTGLTVVLAEYRKAPENRFPAAADDAWAALQWTDENKADLGTAGAPLVVAGDSSGGNLAAVVAQRTVRDGGPEIALQVLVYPVTDAEFETESYNDPANELMLGKQSMVLFWDHYVPDVERRRDPSAAPLQGDPTGTAPALVLVAEHDVLRKEGELYAEKLRSSGVSVEEHLVAGQMHGFFTFPNVLPGAAAGLDLVAAAVERVVGDRA